MAFKPGLRTEDLGVNPDYAFLASEHGMTIRAGVTLDSSGISGPDADGNTLWPAGTVLGKVTASGKFAVYDDGNSDGTEVAVGFLLEEVNFTPGGVATGDLIVAMLTHGSVIVARVSGLDAAARTDMAGRFFWYE